MARGKQRKRRGRFPLMEIVHVTPAYLISGSVFVKLLDSEEPCRLDAEQWGFAISELSEAFAVFAVFHEAERKLMRK